jgi:hypothetical protein
MRFREPYVSEGLNKKLYGPVPSGIVEGGDLTTSLVPMTVEIQPDSVSGDSVYTVSDASGHQLTIRQTGTVQLLLTGVGGTPTTVYIGLSITYSVGADTVVEWRAYSLAEVQALSDKVAIVGCVLVPVSGIIPAANVTPDLRTDAWQDRSTGMRDWRQITVSGDVDLPTPGKASDRWFPYWLTNATGATTVEHDSTYKRSMTHSFKFGGNSGTAAVLPSAGNGGNSPLYPVRAGQRIFYSFYGLTKNTWVHGSQIIFFNFMDEPNSGASLTLKSRAFATSADDVWTKFTGMVEAPHDGWMIWGISSIVDGANTGNLYLDDIRVWLEAGDPLDDQGQAFLMGINRQITGSTLALLPATIPNASATWADSTIRLINTSPADASAISAKMTADPVNGVDLFDWTVHARTTFTGTVTITPPVNTNGLNVTTTGTGIGVESLSANALAVRGYSTGAYGVQGETISPTDGGVAGVGLGLGVTGLAVGGGINALGIRGYGTVVDAGSYKAIGVLGRGASITSADGPAVGVWGHHLALAGLPSVGVFGTDQDTTAPTAEGVGGVFWGKGAVEREVARSFYSGVIGIGGSTSDNPGGHGVLGIGAHMDVTSEFNGMGAYFQGGNSLTGGHGHHGAMFVGGNAVGAGNRAGYGAWFEPGTPGSGGHAGYGIYVAGQVDSPILASYAIRAIGYGAAGGAAALENNNAGPTVDAVTLNSGIRFLYGNSDTESQNPLKNQGMTNILKAIHIPKAWAEIKCATTNPNVEDGMNIDTNIANTKYSGSPAFLILTFKDPMENDNYSVSLTIENSASTVFIPRLISKSAGGMSIRVSEEVDTASHDHSAEVTAEATSKEFADFDLDGSDIIIHVQVMARQTLGAYPTLP